MKSPPNPPEGFDALRAVSAAFGADPMHIQGAGGNASIKSGDVMWIKASGTLLADALAKDIFVATDLGRIRRALQCGDPVADQPAAFLIPGGGTLRPSIETSLHAVFDDRVVLHSHCIHTIAHAVRQDARDLLAAKLEDFDWAYVDYTKPGANLARDVRAALSPTTNVVVLGNHGLIVAGDSADAVQALQHRVHNALSRHPGATATPDLNRLRALSDGSDYDPPGDTALHQLALDPNRMVQVTGGSLYPDHVIFCGMAVTALQQGDSVEDVERRVTDSGAPPPAWIIVPGAGVILRKDASMPAKVMMRCLADVMARVPPEAPLTYLTTDQNLELLNWDAEKYRQSLNG